MGEDGDDDVRYVNVDRILALSTSLRLDESRIQSFDLHSSLRFLLNVLDEESLHAVD